MDTSGRSAHEDRDVELVVRFEPAAGSPCGSVRDTAGNEQRFSGWLGLLRVLEDRYPAQHCGSTQTTEATATQEDR